MTISSKVQGKVSFLNMSLKILWKLWNLWNETRINTNIEDDYNPGIIYATLSSNLLKVSGSAPFISGTLE